MRAVAWRCWLRGYAHVACGSYARGARERKHRGGIYARIRAKDARGACCYSCRYCRRRRQMPDYAIDI